MNSSRSIWQPNRHCQCYRHTRFLRARYRKTNQKVSGFKKIDVDLANGGVMIASAAAANIINEDIEQNILLERDKPSQTFRY